MRLGNMVAWAIRIYTFVPIVKFSTMITHTNDMWLAPLNRWDPGETEIDLVTVRGQELIKSAL